MNKQISSSLAQSIDAFTKLADRLKNEFLRYGTVVILGLIMILIIGLLYKDNLTLPVLALLAYLLVNGYILWMLRELRKAVDLRRSAAQDAKQLKEQVQQDFEDNAKRAFDSFALSASGIITSLEAGELAEGWANNLQERKITGFWRELPRTFAVSLKAEYREPGPLEDKSNNGSAAG